MKFLTMVTMLWTTIGNVLSMFNRFAVAGDNLGKWAEEGTQQWVDEVRAERQIALADRMAKLQAITDSQVKE